MSDQHGKVTRKPDWLKIKLHEGTDYAEVATLIRENNLHTICSSGKCPNQSECWSRRTATFMILGDVCTRSCKFCATKTGKPLPTNASEPMKIARSIQILGLRHCVITSVDRDDLPDGGAQQWKNTVLEIRRQNPATTIELLIPDFDNQSELANIILSAGADIVGHNIETVRRLTPLVRSRAKYDTSLALLHYLADHGARTKSGLMVGLGETSEEVHTTLDDLAATGCQIVTIGQYLQPTQAHWEVAEYVHPSLFVAYKAYALKIGFKHVESAPLVRSSYLADKALEKQETPNKTSICGV